MVKDDEPSIVVCDAGPLIHLDQIDQLDLLRDFSSICIPQQVAYEVARHRPRVPLSSLLIAIEEIEVSVDEPFRVLSRALALDLGEQAALTLARSLQPGCLVLTDDAAARLAAQFLDLPSFGTLGVLFRSIRRGQLAPRTVIEILHSLPVRSTLHVRPALIADLIRRVETEM